MASSKVKRFFSKNNPLPVIDLAAQQRRLRPHLDQALKNILDHGKYILGPECGAFENSLREWTGVPYVMGCSDGTDALLMALMALNVGMGDAVFVPSFTFISTAEVVALRGATPVFVDVDPLTFNVDVESLVRAIEATQGTGLAPKGMITVDLFGQPCDHDRLQKVATDHGLWVIVDAAQSMGATYQGRHTVSYGVIATTSFYPAKPLGGYGDGGAIFTSDTELHEKLKSIHVHGQGKGYMETERLGITGRLDTMQAAILSQKLRVFPEEIEARNRVADRYRGALAKWVEVPQVLTGSRSVWAQYTIRTPHRDALKAHLFEAGVSTALYYHKPLHQQPPYQHFPVTPGGLPATERLAREVLSLPMHGYVDPEVQDQVIEVIEEFFTSRS